MGEGVQGTAEEQGSPWAVALFSALALTVGSQLRGHVGVLWSLCPLWKASPPLCTVPPVSAA